MANRIEEVIARTVSDHVVRSLSGPECKKLLVDVGDKVQPLIVMKVRATQDFGSPVLGEVSLGTVMHVTEVGSGGRIKISTGKVAGWISFQSELGQPLVKKERKEPKGSLLLKVAAEATAGEVVPESNFKLHQEPLKPGVGLYARGELAVGQKGETLVSMNVREGESFNSKVVGRLAERTQFEVASVGANDRIRIISGDLVGWISSKAEGCRPLVRAEKRRPSFKFKGLKSEDTANSVTTVPSTTSLPESVVSSPGKMYSPRDEAPPELPPVSIPKPRSAARRSPWRHLLCCGA